MSTVPCTECGEEIEEGEIYGEWDDLCQSCYKDLQEEEADERRIKILDQLCIEDEVEDALRHYRTDPTDERKRFLIERILLEAESAKEFLEENE